MIDFHTFFTRVQEATSIATQHDLAKALGVNRSAITQAKRRNSVPQKWVLALSRSFQLSVDWLEFGSGRPEAQIDPSLLESTATFTVPKVLARLCAGDGSFEVEATPIEEHIFKESWLAQKGTPSAMVLMDVIGDSMEPFICQGDTVLVDQSQTTLRPDVIYAVGIDDSIMVKRVAAEHDKITLLSDNPAYSPITVQGDELLSFRVIGRVVWSARDY
ncbi:LexA family transcriptional regulator [Halodesulfovibrio marinisediminis]|uniref:Phage repressor protein C, contains Cro/C1-type HTH and peptisase s24 domains n=1 Tax=Halodesulfovibrio marinisediminis DSM 17456 TaxID=1121457 RepID=A0A1N6E5M9_9BACT|nr:S24 family peptidase [Halodesulfovibrio marinisediminis]SIN78283.1 Phage repressor protein C, contains Cro/C1-type HTH and peptisase s24 domains [Halodesulfovibrio marinisediminis DSM 17456]